MAHRSCLVTVGTTQCEALMAAMSGAMGQWCAVLAARGVTRLVIQIGTGTIVPGDEAVTQAEECGVQLDVVRFIPALSSSIERGVFELVVTHAGAGTILECLRAQCPFLIVVNDTLMDNHQLQIADAMQQEHGVAWATPTHALDALMKLKPASSMPTSGLDHLMPLISDLVEPRQQHCILQ